MADDKDGREAQARNEADRQRRRDVEAELERSDESEPPIDDADLAQLELDLASVAFPATGAAVVSTVGDREVRADADRYAVEQLVPETDAVRFGSPADVTSRVRQPTVAAAMKRIAEAAGSLPSETLDGSQYDGYERTFRELERIDPVDGDEPVGVVCDWVVKRIREKETLPSSRAVRREAGTTCRRAGYEVSNDEWLGI
jgi:hypothetical protein